MGNVVGGNQANLAKDLDMCFVFSIFPRLTDFKGPCVIDFKVSFKESFYMYHISLGHVSTYVQIHLKFVRSAMICELSTLKEEGEGVFNIYWNVV